MGNMVVIDNLNFKYSNKVVFKGLSLSISTGSFTTILGNNGSGKSTLVKLLAGLEKSNSCIMVDGMLFCNKNISSIVSDIGVVFDNFNSSLFSTVFEMLSFPLRNMGYSDSDVVICVNDISKDLGIVELLGRNPDSLSCSEKQIVNFGCALIKKPKLLILDEAFSMLDDITRVNMLLLLKHFNKEFGITIMNFSHDIEESLYGGDILIIDSGKVVIHDSKENVYKQEKLLRSLDFNLPFMVDLSNKLSYYDMIDDVIYDMDEMVDLLWK